MKPNAAPGTTRRVSFKSGTKTEKQQKEQKQLAELKKRYLRMKREIDGIFSRDKAAGIKQFGLVITLWKDNFPLDMDMKKSLDTEFGYLKQWIDDDAKADGPEANSNYNALLASISISTDGSNSKK